MIYFKTNYYLKPKYLSWFIGIVAFAYIFISLYFPYSQKQQVEIVLAIFYAILFLVVCFYFFFETLDKKAIENEIIKLEYEKSNTLECNSFFEKEDLLKKYKKAHETLADSATFVHLIKSKDQITKDSNLGNYFKICIILLLAYHSVDYIKPFGPNIFIGVVFMCIIFCIRILIWEVIERDKFTSPIAIGHALVIYMLFIFGKNTYISSYGDEILGSYFEKFEYRTQYYVNVFPDGEESKNYRLPAEIHVYSEEEEGEPTEDAYGIEHSNAYTIKYIVLDKVFWSNEGYLEFNDCQLEVGKKVQCNDQDGESWTIELTNEKVK
jgi:hypothetical protein